MTIAFKTYSKEQCEQILASQPEGQNTKFLKSAHNLWFRFKNYESNPAFVLEDQGNPCSLVFATISKRSRYMNLYEIVTLEGKEGHGYASKIWDEVMRVAFDSGVQRLKISCTPSSVSWHKRNGLVFWAVDPSGSLRSDQPLFRTREEQIAFRSEALTSPELAFPRDAKVVEQLVRESLESHGFGKKKTEKVSAAIQEVGDFWLRDSLVSHLSPNTIGEFFD